MEERKTERNTVLIEIETHKPRSFFRESETSEYQAMICQKCGRETFLPFKCQYCGGHFCSEHRLPENHECPRIAQARVPKDETHPVMAQWQKPIEYKYTYVPVRPAQRGFHFSIKELGHLALATVLVVGVGISLDFASVANGGYLLLALSVVGFTASFLMHEMAHKIVAQKHGLWAEFRLTASGAIITAISIALPFKFISPGAVMVAGADQRTMGKTAVAGPATNIVLATIFSAAVAALPSYTLVFGVIAWFNAWIAVFNLIPFGIFDGLKVFMWNKKVWALAFAVSAVLTVGFWVIFLG
jgi:Zn-dependent protease